MFTFFQVLAVLLAISATAFATYAYNDGGEEYVSRNLSHFFLFSFSLRVSYSPSKIVQK